MVRIIQCAPHAGLPKVWLGFGEIGDRQFQLQAKQDAYFDHVAPNIRFVHRNDQVSYWYLHRDVLFRQAKWFPWKYKDPAIREFVLPPIVRLEQIPKILQFLYTGDYSVERDDLRRYQLGESPQGCVNCPQMATLLAIHSDMVQTAGFLGMQELQALAFVRFRTLLDAAPVMVLRHAICHVYDHGRICPATHHSNGFPMLVMGECDYRPQLILPAVLRWCGYYRLHPKWTSVNGRPKHYGEQQFTQLRQRIPEFDSHLTRGLFLDTIAATAPTMILHGETRPIRCVDPTNRPEIMSMKSNPRRSNYQYATFLQPLPFENPEYEQEKTMVDSDTEMSDSPEDEDEDDAYTEKHKQAPVSNRRVTRSMVKTTNMTSMSSAVSANTRSRITKRQQQSTHSAVQRPKHSTPAQAPTSIVQTSINDSQLVATQQQSQLNYPAAAPDANHSFQIQALEGILADTALQNIDTTMDLNTESWVDYLNAPLTEADLALANEGLQTTESQTSVHANVEFNEWVNPEALAAPEANMSFDELINGIDLEDFPLFPQSVAPEWTSTDDVTIFRMHAEERDKISWEDEGDLERPTGPEAPVQSSGFDEFEETFWNNTNRHGLRYIPAGMTPYQHCVDLLCQVLEKVEENNITIRPEAMVNYLLVCFPDVDLFEEVQNLIDALPEEYKFSNMAQRIPTNAEQESPTRESELSLTLTEQIEALTDADRAEFGSAAGSLDLEGSE
ncbi:uncharacterized protein N7511_000072 [Penicillium nucicola]|uniref:uncharacterized protein n=1 Tax=Penicillium nucicola TaxID=1850975 RepID=UPI002544E7A7|nr:uncharacterized protein N7511_000072 [Penicillium nucicola]KAJ5775061.1 hypothetical protein N7511_000072 [Penicillium nucicola]